MPLRHEGSSAHARERRLVGWCGGDEGHRLRTEAHRPDREARRGENRHDSTLLRRHDRRCLGSDRRRADAVLRSARAARRQARGARLDGNAAHIERRSGASRLCRQATWIIHSRSTARSGIAAAQQNFDADAKDSSLAMCTLLPQAKAEALLGRPLVKAPQPGSGSAGARECTYTTVLAAPGVIPQEYDVTLWEWRDGAVEFANDQFASHMGTRAMRRQLTGDTTPPADTAELSCGAVGHCIAVGESRIRSRAGRALGEGRRLRQEQVRSRCLAE